MNLTIQASTLSGILAFIGRHAVQLPGKTERLVTISGDTSLTVTDGGSEPTRFVDASVAANAPTPVTVNLTNLATALKALDKASCTITADSRRVRIRSGATEYTLRTSEFEADPSPKSLTASPLLVSPGHLADALEDVAFSISSDDNRYGVNGVYLELVDLPCIDGPEKLGIRFTSTDGSRLSYSEIEADTALFTVPPKVLLSRPTVRAIIDLCNSARGDDAPPVALRMDDRTVSLDAGAWTITRRLVSAEFPEYRQVLPKDHKRVVTVNAGHLMATLRTVRVLANDRNHLIRFDVSQHRPVGSSAFEWRITVSATSVDVGDAKAQVKCAMSGDKIVTGFSATYLLDAIGRFDPGDDVTISMGEPLDPTIITSGGKLGALFVVMPMRLD